MYISNRRIYDDSVSISASAEYAATYSWWGNPAGTNADTVFNWYGSFNTVENVNWLYVTVDAGNGCVVTQNVPAFGGYRNFGTWIADFPNECLSDPGYLLSVDATSNDFDHDWYYNGMQQTFNTNFPYFQLFNGNGTYMLSITDNLTSCQSPMPATVEITGIQPYENPTFNYSQSIYSQSETDPVPTITGVAGGIFTEASGQVLFIDANTGEIDLAMSTAGGPYTIQYTTSGPCPETGTFEVTITSNATLMELDENTVQFYPNPAKEKLFISNINLLDNEVEIYGIEGCKIMSTNREVIDVSQLAPGVYFAHFTINGSQEVYRFEKQ